MKSAANKIREISAAVLAIGLPLLLLLQYQYLDHSVQRNDNSFHLLETQNGYLAIKSHGLIKGVQEAFFNRAFRPILMPHLAIPIFFLTGGDARLTVILFLLGCYGFFLTYVFLLLRQYLKGVDLALGTLILGLSPTVVHFTQDFNSELPMLAVFIPFLYYLKRSEFFREEKASKRAGLFMGLSICIRPIETILVSGIIGLPYLLVARKKKLLRDRDLLVFGLIVAVGAGFLLYQLKFENTRPHNEKARYLLLAFLPLIPVLLRKQLGLAKNIWWFFGLTFSLSMFWYAPVAEALYGWVSQASFSTFTQNTGSREGVSIWHFLVRAAQFGTWPLWAATLALASVWIPRIKKTSVRDMAPLWMVLPAILIPLWIGSLTYNGDPKEYLLGDVMITLVALVLALAPKTRFHWVRTAVFVLITVLLIQLRLAVIHMNPEGSNPVVDFWKENIHAADLQPPTSHDRLSEDYAEFTKHLAHSPAEPRMRICILQMRQNTDLDWIADDFALTILAQQNGEHWLFDDPFPYVAPTVQGKYEWVKSNCARILVLPIEHIPNVPIDFFMSDVGELVLSAWQKNKLKEDGLALEEKGQYYDNHHHTGDYLMLRPLQKRQASAN